MWIMGFGLSVGLFAAAILTAVLTGRHGLHTKWRLGWLNALLIGTFLSALVMFATVHFSTESGNTAGFLSLLHAMQIFTIGTEFDVITGGMASCPTELTAVFQVWAVILFVLAPIFTFGFVLSLFRNISSHLLYFCCFFRDVYVFSELNDKSLMLAEDIRAHCPKACIVFTDVYEGEGESGCERLESAKELGAICFKRDILVIRFQWHSSGRQFTFFTIGQNETENLNQTVKLIERYRSRKNTRIYAFSTKIEGELLLTSIDKGKLIVRRVNEAQALINRILYEDGERLFRSAAVGEDGERHIRAMVVGLGRHGQEMVKSLAWFGQMDGYHIRIEAFDRDEGAGERLFMQAPELIADEYNGVSVAGEAEYSIELHGGVDVGSEAFARRIAQGEPPTYVLIALGDDNANINTAVYLRMLFERKGCKPIIQSVVYNPSLCEALQDVKNFRDKPYDIEFIGDTKTSYSYETVLNSQLENEARDRHLKGGYAEDMFWNYEYFYRSSVASAIHLKARIACGIPGADKAEDELTEAELERIEALEHRRWNAYMRAQGYVYGKERNDLAKTHPDLVCFDGLTDEEKRKDRRIGLK